MFIICHLGFFFLSFSFNSSMVKHTLRFLHHEKTLSHSTMDFWMLTYQYNLFFLVSAGSIYFPLKQNVLCAVGRRTTWIFEIGVFLYCKLQEYGVLHGCSYIVLPGTGSSKWGVSCAFSSHCCLMEWMGGTSTLIWWKQTS